MGIITHSASPTIVSEFILHLYNHKIYLVIMRCNTQIIVLRQFVPPQNYLLHKPPPVKTIEPLPTGPRIDHLPSPPSITQAKFPPWPSCHESTPPKEKKIRQPSKKAIEKVKNNWRATRPRCLTVDVSASVDRVRLDTPLHPKYHRSQIRCRCQLGAR